MEWNITYNFPPVDKPFLAIWEGVCIICEYDEEEDCYYGCLYPAQYKESFKIKNDDIRYWMPLPEPPTE